MKKYFSCTLITGILVYSGLITAEPSVELIWASTSGNGTPGSSAITAEQGDVLQLDVLVNGDPDGIASAAMSLSWAPHILTGYGAQECPSPPNLTPSMCVDTGDVTLQPTFLGVDESQGKAEGFDAVSLPGAWGIIVPGYYSETMYLGRVEFVVETEATSAIVVEYRSESGGVKEGVLDTGDFVFYYPAAEATIHPPAGC